MTIDINNESDFEIDLDLYKRVGTFMVRRMFLHESTDLSVLFVDEDAMEKLHMQWMDLPGPTDVMSFPMDELRPGRPDAPAAEGILGDIVICPQVAERQAENAGYDAREEMIMLIIHGTLHLLGFDHVTPEEESRMFALQQELFSTFLDKDKGY